MYVVTIGPELIKIIKHAKQADLPILLVGGTGIGKSEIFQQAATQLGIGYICRDLSIMEPPDLQGLPVIKDGRTSYVSPSFLPQAGEGLMVLEELNRSPRYMRAPCLQLLTDRSLNDYKLPKGWLPCASINPNGDDYDVDDLDQALLSRFLVIHVKADPEAWVAWAEGKNLHSKVVLFVKNNTSIFDSSIPRSWAAVSKLIDVNEKDGNDKDLLAIEIAGKVPDKWAGSFMSFYSGTVTPLTAKDIIENYESHRSLFQQLVVQNKMDVVAESSRQLTRKLKSERVQKEVLKNPHNKSNVEAFMNDLPGDLRQELRKFLMARGFDFSSL